MNELFQQQLFEVVIPLIAFGLLYLVYMFVKNKRKSSRVCGIVYNTLTKILDRNNDGKVDFKDVPSHTTHSEKRPDLHSERSDDNDL